MFTNDPKVDMIPSLGKGTVDIAIRTHCGQAAIYDGADPQALIDFLGDTSLHMIAGDLFRSTPSGDYTRVVIPANATIVFRPPAGDWRFLTPDQLAQEFAICERGKVADIIEAGPKPAGAATPKPTLAGAPAKKAPAKKAAAPK